MHIEAFRTRLYLSLTLMAHNFLEFLQRTHSCNSFLIFANDKNPASSFPSCHQYTVPCFHHVHQISLAYAEAQGEVGRISHRPQNPRSMHLLAIKITFVRVCCSAEIKPVDQVVDKKDSFHGSIHLIASLLLVRAHHLSTN